MADVKELEAALIKADAAGNADDARVFAAEIRKMREREALSPVAGMSTGEKFAAGAGKAVTDVGRGVRQLSSETAAEHPYAVPEIMRLLDRLAPFSKKEVAESRKLDAPLMKTGGGMAGNVAGNIATVLPTMFVPGANTYTGAATIGGLLGATQPVAEGESRALNTAAGAGAGVVGQGVGNAIGRVLKPVQSALPAQEARLAAEAARRNIPLTAGQATGSRPLQVAESVMENLPFTAGPQLAQKQAQKSAFNRAVGSTFGSAEDALTPQVLGDARSRIGQQFTELAGRNTLKADDALMNSLSQIDDEARKYLTPDVGKVVLNRIDDVMARIENGSMSGTAYRNLDSELGKASRSASSGDLRHALGQLRSALREAMDGSISPADKTAWQQARRQYANLMTVAPIAAKDELGNVSGRTLLNAANTSNKNAKFGGTSELAELGRVGRAFVADNVPNSGTAQRQFMQSLMTGGGGAGIGAVGAAATGNDPVQGALIGGGVTAGGLLAPRAFQALMNSPAGQAYLKQGLLPLTKAQLAALNAASRSGAIGLLGNSGE